MAVADGIVVATGTNADVRAQFPGAREVNLLGQTVIPGLIDAHVHLLGLGLVRQTSSLVGAGSLSELRARLEYARRGLLGRRWKRGRAPPVI